MIRLLCVAAAAACAACTPEAFKDVPLEACTELAASGNLTLRLVDADAEFLRLRGAPDAVAAAIVEAGDGKVTVQGEPVQGEDVALDASCPQLRSLQLLGSITADLGQTMPPLERVAVYGSSTLTGAGVNAADLDVRVSGEGRVDLAQLDVGNMQILVGGSGQAVVSGAASVLTLNATGQARVDAGELRAQTVNLEATSSSVVTTWATAHLDAVARGSASVVYTGTPDLNVKTEDKASIESPD